MGYTLIIGRVDKDRFAEKEEDRDKAVYQGRCDHINELNIPSIEVAHQIAKLCNVTTYCIAEGGDSWDKELVFCTQDILDYDKKVEQERVERSKTQSALADHINSQPKEFSPSQFAYSACQVVFRRSEAEYNPKRIGKVQWHLTAFVKSLDATKEIPKLSNGDQQLSLELYKSRGTHARLYKRFLHDWGWRFTEGERFNILKEEGFNHPDFKRLWADLPAIEKEYWETYHRIEGQNSKGGVS